MHHNPQFEQLAGGTWRASYAGTGWSVVAATKEAATIELQAEDQRRVQRDPAYRKLLFELARGALRDPVPDIEAEQISRGEYWYQTGGRDRVTVERDAPTDS